MNEIAKVEAQEPAGASLPATVEPGALLGAMLELARDPAFDVSKLTALADLQQRMEDREAERQLTTALQQAQSEIPQIEKRGVIPKKDGKSIPFATEQDIDNVLRPICQKYGFTLHYSSESPRPGLIIITTTLRHKAGASVSASVPLPIDEGPGRNTTQAHGSTISYGRRYGKEQIFNIVRKGLDDDGTSAHHKTMTPDHVAELGQMMKDGGISEAALLQHVYADRYRTLEEVPEADFVRLKQLIEERNRQKAAKAKG